MNYNNKKHLFAYFIFAGMLMYLLHAALQSVFIISLPMEEGWAVETVQTDEREYITEFKNELEQAKYYHNTDMLKRNKYLMFGEFLFVFGISYLVFHLIPKWKNILNNESGLAVFFTIGIISFIVLFIAPLVFSIILPTPSEWFPDIFIDTHDKLVKSELEHLEKVFGKE